MGSHIALLCCMLPLSGQKTQPKIWYRIPGNMGVTVLFVVKVRRLSGKVCSLLGELVFLG